MPTTANAPKCFAEVQGKRMLDWMLHAIHEAGIDVAAVSTSGPGTFVLLLLRSSRG